MAVRRCGRLRCRSGGRRGRVVALDSATVVWTDCGFAFVGPATKDVADMTWLYYVWGFVIAALMYQAVRVAGYSPGARGACWDTRRIRPSG